MSNKNSKDLIEIFTGKKVPKKYSKYSDTSSGGGIYHRWSKYNDELIENPQFNWSGIFELPEDLSYINTYRKTGKIIPDKIGDKAVKYAETVKTGYLRPKFEFLSFRVSSDDFDQLLSRLNLKIGEEISFQQIPVITSYRDSLLNQMNRQASEINRLNAEIASVLKVYYFESEEEAKTLIKNANTKPEKEALSRSFLKSIREIRNIFSVLKGGIHSEEIQKTQIHEYISSNQFIDDYLKETTLFGIQYLSEKKDPLLDISEKFAKEIYVLESVIEDKFLNNRVSALPEKEEPRVEQIIDLAIHDRKVKKENKKHAKKFLRSYTKMKNENPLYTPANYIREIGMTKVSTNSYRQWMDNFDEAERMLLNDE